MSIQLFEVWRRCLQRCQSIPFESKCLWSYKDQIRRCPWPLHGSVHSDGVYLGYTSWATFQSNGLKAPGLMNASATLAIFTLVTPPPSSDERGVDTRSGDSDQTTRHFFGPRLIAQMCELVRLHQHPRQANVPSHGQANLLYIHSYLARYVDKVRKHVTETTASPSVCTPAPSLMTTQRQTNRTSVEKSLSSVRCSKRLLSPSLHWCCCRW